jgi:hypothetical protein
MKEKTLIIALLNAIDYIEDLSGDSTDFITEEILGLQFNRDDLVDRLEDIEAIEELALLDSKDKEDL